MKESIVSRISVSECVCITKDLQLDWNYVLRRKTLSLHSSLIINCSLWNLVFFGNCEMPLKQHYHVSLTLFCPIFWWVAQVSSVYDIFSEKETKAWVALPKTVSSAGSLSRSPTMFVPTQVYMPASLFLVLEIISFPPRICFKTKNIFSTSYKQKLLEKKAVFSVSKLHNQGI